ncbi:MAG: putative ABC transporter permease [Clostridia bacterium]|nr:putative ABC transporter permease [Clostridia bacterium]
MSYEPYQFAFFVLIYSFIGWLFETLVYSFSQRKLINTGFLTLPFIMTYGLTMAILVGILPTFGTNVFYQYLSTLIVSSVIERLCLWAAHRLCPGIVWARRSSMFDGHVKGVVASLLIALGFLGAYHLLHAPVLLLLSVVPPLVIKILTLVLWVLILADLVLVVTSCRRGKYPELYEQSSRAHLSNRLRQYVWNRIQRAYPGVPSFNDSDAEYTFGKGLSFDKLIWVFLITALAGDITEFLYCGLVDHSWMHRSSVLYGPFSFVWGIGAVLLTIALTHLARKSYVYVFLGGFFIGGVYEYLCSVFTERVFGTIFWTYAHLPLNIGGRTNLLFCFFWGLLSLLWVRIIYPSMSKLIEKIPPITGKIVTWVLVTFMVLNGALTMTALIRFRYRPANPEPRSELEEFIDQQYPDERIQNRWPNMKIVPKDTPEPEKEQATL